MPLTAKNTGTAKMKAAWSQNEVNHEGSPPPWGAKTSRDTWSITTAKAARILSP